MNYVKIGNFIAERRKEKGFTQNDLAKRINVTDKAVSKWERGLGCPDISILEALSRQLDVSVLELLNGNKMEHDVINMTQADTYIRDTFEASKKMFNNELKKKISIILMSISIFIIVIISVFNINTYRTLTEKEDLEFSSWYKEDYLNENMNFYDKKEKLKVYVNLIERNKGSLTVEEQQSLVSYLNNLYEFYDKGFMFNLTDGVKLSYNDIYVNLARDFNIRNYPSILPAMRIYREYLGKNYPEDLVEKTRQVVDAEEKFIRVYEDKFKNQLQFEIEDTDFETIDFIFTDIVTTHIEYMNPIFELIEGIMKEAGIHE